MKWKKNITWFDFPLDADCALDGFVANWKRDFMAITTFAYKPDLLSAVQLYC